MGESKHWAETIADRITARHPDKEEITIASGITPSGVIHIGNFREVITVDLVYKALLKKGRKVRFIFSWDDYDVFRKVPPDMPRQEMLKEHLGKPIIKTPDPFEEESSYARHHEQKLEKSLARVDIKPRYLYQAEKYRNLEYTALIKKALEKKKEIAAILDRYRTSPLPPEWLPISIFCSKCDSNDVAINLKKDFSIDYSCRKCKAEVSTDLNDKNIKLLWRIDWPMRWFFEGVDFEPGGKDHSSDGGSYDTAKEIAKEIYGIEPPIYVMYDFIRIKGKGGKISSSKGGVITLDEVLEIYEPEIVRYLFASYRTNVEFAISFDLDVLKIYEDYDRLEQKYFNLSGVSAKKQNQVKWVYELSQLGAPPDAQPVVLLFRHLCNVLQINDFNFEAAAAYYQDQLKTEYDHAKIKSRLKCAANWLKEYAPEEFKFSLNPAPVTLELEPALAAALSELKNNFKKYEKSDIEEKLISEEIYGIINKHKVDNNEFFKAVYLLLISRERAQAR